MTLLWEAQMRRWQMVDVINCVRAQLGLAWYQGLGTECTAWKTKCTCQSRGGGLTVVPKNSKKFGNPWIREPLCANWATKPPTNLESTIISPEEASWHYTLVILPWLVVINYDLNWSTAARLNCFIFCLNTTFSRYRKPILSFKNWGDYTGFILGSCPPTHTPPDSPALPPVLLLLLLNNNQTGMVWIFRYIE